VVVRDTEIVPSISEVSYPETTSPDERIVMGKYIRRLGGWYGGALGEVVVVRSRWEREVGIKREYAEGVGGVSGAAYGSYGSRASPAEGKVVVNGTRRRLAGSCISTSQRMRLETGS
jgi:hypothetical protein